MEQITINLLATGITPVCHVSQFDDGRTIRINLKKGADIFTLSGTEEVKMRIRKPDDTERVADIVNTSSSYVDYVSIPEDCDIEGVNVCELVVGEAGSKNFLMNVEEDAYGGGADIETLSASGPIATFETNMVDNLVDLKAEITPIQDLHGYDYPWPAGGGKNILLKPFIHYSLAPDNLADMFFIKAGDYRFSFSDSTAENWRIGLRMKDAEGNNLTDNAHKPNSGMSWRSEGNYWLAGSNSTNKSISITIAEDCYIRVIFGYASTTADTEFTNTQLEKGTTQTNYEPVENICPITGHAEAKIVHSGKNLLDTRQESIPQYAGGSGVYANVTYTPNNDGSITINGTSTGASVLFFDPVTLNPLTSHPFPTWKYTNNRYTFSVTDGWGLVTGDAYIQATVKKIKDDSIVSRQRLTASVFTRSFTVREDEYIADAFVRLSSGASASNINIKIQLELGSAATDYEPYAGTEVTVQFGQTVYKGYLDAKNSKVIATHVLGNFDGSNDEMWNDYPTGNGFFVSGISNHIKESYGDGLCNILPTSKSIGNLGVVYGINSQYIFIMQVKTAWNISTVSDLRTFLASNPLQIMYKLATPIEIPLSAISQFETLLGINNVYSDIGDVELKYLKQV